MKIGKLSSTTTIDCIDTTDFWIIEEEIPDFRDEEVNNIINQNNSVPMLTETFNIVGAQGNFLKFVCYFILLYVFIYFNLNELFFLKIYDNDLGVDIFGTSDIRSGCSSNPPLVLRDGDDDV